MRCYALSDIHIDHRDNLQWIENLSKTSYQKDALILAGDATHILEKLRHVLRLLKDRFQEVFFVPGNHELWAQSSEHSLEKFHRILSLCRGLDVHTEPQLLKGTYSAWVVPLFSWYTQPHEGENSLFLEKKGEDPNLTGWTDLYFVKWPDFGHDVNPSSHFQAMNRDRVERQYGAPVISFSHFLPRRDLIFGERKAQSVSQFKDPHPHFNFSRVAGDAAIDQQIRRLGSRIHIYGHQHRNRYRVTDHVLYVSHCLGYGVERKNGFIQFLETEPRLVWDTETPGGNQDLPKIED